VCKHSSWRTSSGVLLAPGDATAGALPPPHMTWSEALAPAASGWLTAAAGWRSGGGIAFSSAPAEKWTLRSAGSSRTAAQQVYRSPGVRMTLRDASMTLRIVLSVIVKYGRESPYHHCRALVFERRKLYGGLTDGRSLRAALQRPGLLRREWRVGRR
jgi:hypothetical protein